MGRPRTIATETIVDAARELFLEQGPGVSTAAIARAAGVSEGTIFKRFKTKDELFHVAMGLPQCPLFDEFPELELELADTDPQRLLVDIARVLIDYFRELMPRLMALKSHPTFDPLRLVEGDDDSPPLRGLRELTRLFGQLQAAGKLGGAKPEIVARVLLGSLNGYVFYETLLGRDDELYMPADEFVRSVVELLWRGAGPDPTKPSDDDHGRHDVSNPTEAS